MSEYSIGAIGRAEKVMFQKHLLEQNFSGEELAFKEPAQKRDAGRRGGLDPEEFPECLREIRKLKSRERKVLRPERQLSQVLEGFTCQGEDFVLERQLGSRKNASGSFSLKRWTWKRSRVAGERSWTQRTTWEGRGHSFIELARHLNGAIVDKMM